MAEAFGMEVLLITSRSSAGELEACLRQDRQRLVMALTGHLTEAD
ncbi:MAG: hypothetical protein O2839_08375 [Cyanobacteria bacterium]|nr:hypothetical protein [Cyanobacteriota bacterium]MDA1245993.1 hypothetical protein [Cyanobacteriota bacterium]